MSVSELPAPSCRAELNNMEISCENLEARSRS